MPKYPNEIERTKYLIYSTGDSESQMKNINKEGL